MITVTFVDSLSGGIAAETPMPISLLPDSFAPATTMILAGNPWIVESAHPLTREEFEVSKALRLVVRREHPDLAMSPPDVTFTTPTIWDPLPAMASLSTIQPDLQLEDDDWRDVELVHASHDAAITENFDAIRLIYLEHRKKRAGFAAMHVRRRPDDPLSPTTLAADAVLATFPAIAQVYGSLTFRDYRGIVENGFGFRTKSGLIVYGTATVAGMGVLGLVPWKVKRGGDDATAIADLMEAHGLHLVVWRQGQRLRTRSEVSHWLAKVQRRR